MAMASKAYEGGRVKELTGRCLDLGTNGQDKRGHHLRPSVSAAAPPVAADGAMRASSCLRCKTRRG